MCTINCSLITIKTEIIQIDFVTTNNFEFEFLWQKKNKKNRENKNDARFIAWLYSANV